VAAPFRRGRRDIPLDHRLVVELRTVRTETDWSADDDLVFANEAGGPIDKDNLRRRHLRPAGRGGRSPMGGPPHLPPHLRLAALRARRERRSGPAVARASFAASLSTYVHWIDGEDLGEPLALQAELERPGAAHAHGLAAVGAWETRRWRIPGRAYPSLKWRKRANLRSSCSPRKRVATACSSRACLAA
jgi:hypothetical protein